MPKFKLRERRAYIETITIEAEDEDAARRLEGTILETEEGDAWADELLSVEGADDAED